MPVSIITVCERREARGLDAHVPLILRGDALYDPDLDRFFLDLPLSGVRSRHSLRAYAYDVVVWLRFLDACGKTVWAATRDDVDAYHRERRRDEADHRITASSWNRAVASLDRLYRWGEQQGLIADAPFSRRAVWRPAQGGRRGMIATRNDAYERVAKRSDVRFVTMDDYRIFREVGLRGLTPDGTERPGARDRNGLRDDLRERASRAFPSLIPHDAWRGREDRTLMRNAYADFGVSVYGGLVAVWIVERDDGPYWDADWRTARSPRAQRWLSQIASRFDAMFGDYDCLGHMSNGEGVYTKRAA